jgi:hypothetical protein
MADVQAGAGRVGEHVQDVVLGLVRAVFGPEGVGFLPDALPMGLDLEELVFFAGGR